MKKNTVFLLIVVFSASVFQMGMARRGEYDEEAREAERIAKFNHTEQRRSGSPVHTMAEGIRDVVTAPAGFISETAQGTVENAPGIGTLEGVNAGSEKLLDKTLKGTVKVATFGLGELHNYEVQEPEAGSGEPTKIKIKIPGT